MVNFVDMIDLKIDFNKFADGLVPAIIQDHLTSKVLMLGYMNQEAFDITMSSTKITFFSRSKQRLWTKGEESGNFMEIRTVAVDCDSDALLFKVHPFGPVCHTGADTCWDEKNHSDDFLTYLEEIIELRKKSTDGSSYVQTLMAKGINKVAQKVGEEAVELVIEAKDHDDDKFINEAADLMFHYLLLINMKGFSLQSVKEILKKRHTK
jgi:phosphoribosyl-ATP pyrophosphohydrolase/phosphoribosyl-AMP cyclohydrolase